MTPYTDLLARLEAATEGSRELDEAIARFIGELPANAVFSTQNPGDGSEHYQWDTGERDEYGPLLDGTILKQRTRSLDDALTLVPEGWHLDLHDWTWAEEPKWNAALQRCQGVYEKVNGISPTSAPLAVTIAALRARQSLEERA